MPDEKSATLTVAADLAGIRTTDAVTVLLYGAPPTGSRRLIFTRSMMGPNDGTAAISVDVPNAQRFMRFDLEATVKRDGKISPIDKTSFLP